VKVQFKKITRASRQVSFDYIFTKFGKMYRTYY